MGSSLDVHGRTRAAQIAPRRVALVGLTALLVIAALGCGKRTADQKSTDGPRAAESEPKATSASKAPAGARRGDKVETAAARPDVVPSGRTNLIRLTSKGCVQLEPHWRTIRVGQTLEWRSDLESPVTIHVSPGAFDKAQFVVRPGGTVSSGPARTLGSFSIWTEPAACQGVPRGVQGSGPGVTVTATP